VLVQSPAETKTDLQIFCLFRSSPMNPLYGSLIEINERLHGLLDQLRTPGLFNGDLGETILLTPGGVTTFSTADVAEQLVRGLRDALAAESLLRNESSAGPLAVDDFTFLAGTKHAADTQSGINRALGLSTPSAQ
jgi:hypothetical protein